MKNILKLILLLLVLGASAYVLLVLFGWLATAFWYIFWIGIVLIAGTVGYKLFLTGDTDSKQKLEEPKPTAISEFENTDRLLEEYRSKYVKED